MQTVKEIIRSLQSGESKPSEWVELSIQQIERAESSIQSFLSVQPEMAIQQAKKLDESQPSGSLYGVPYALKDNICTEGLRTTAASRILENYIPPYSATVAEKLQNENAVLVGKTNLDEFAMGSSTENSAFQKTHNPHRLGFVPGGSSGGSAAAVAANMVPFALGSDTGGSIRQPAAFCGVVGLKPTYGRVSRFGLIAFASSLDQIGPFTQTVEDAALVLEAISGYDPHDSTSAKHETERFSQALTGDIKGMRVGVLPQDALHGLDNGVADALQNAIRTLSSAGAEIVEIDLPHQSYAVATYYLIAPAEASSNLARYDGVRYGRRASGETLLEMYEKTRSEGFGLEVKRRIMIGTYALSSGYYDAFYKRAQKMRTLIRQDYEKAFAKCDVILTPTTPTTAFRMGEKLESPLQMYLNDIFTIPANLAGLPGISVPCGKVDGLPVGMQLVGRAFDEATLLRVAHAYEQLRGFSVQLAAEEVGQ
ncbi:Asp-tRNA(Asn)/Glu-tRNA(Gln) amidotransferase subunit GatA [Alicyclobacillus sp. TC]|uniref:Glutamyl-tRNA(Gln) amidotransferase subunit A n=1 Tax=Alicyclobacillus tolerans TaxID=90970 RepID=A0A1M6NXJ6_9BACL|nr:MULTISPECIES: Asp-tRNA(Asn)/Glu-tRNA(Gln) amidotransferase subunit GatA [Alicyclobacillus]QRF22725.1 Asp-tRNA(Asn)/Glu-tRNA(Gln) amidotransferase subunit GatA [Alicyclobacillus sp. TC]SHK00396.1 aspartyl/glutamyl-tRNA(Asn/Gln) amidotransferase subunit A [Alicyclobacillus montanus]